MTNREREARIRERVEATRQGKVTLYTGCERATSDLRFLLARVERYREALEEVLGRPAEAVEKMREHGFVFETDLSRDDLTEAERWEKLAFTIYTMLVTSAEHAHRALNDGEDDA